MKLLNQIKIDSTNAFKAGEKEKKMVLSLLVSEIQRNEPQIINEEKFWSDDLSIKTIQRMMKDNILCSNEHENKYLAVYLPQVMSDEELTQLIKNFITKPNIIWWQVNGRKAKDFSNKMNDESVTMLSGFDGSTIQLVLGGEQTIIDEKTGETRKLTPLESMIKVLDQEVLNQLKV